MLLSADSDLPINCSAPTKEEIQNSIKPLRNGKAAGPDNIPAEALRVRTNVELLYPLFNNIWEEERVPTQWKEGYLIKLPKKGDLSSCSNYRGVTLLSIPGKVFNRVLLNRMKDAIDPQLREQQAGSRKNRSCTDKIATLRIILSSPWSGIHLFKSTSWTMKKHLTGGPADTLEATETLRIPEDNQYHQKLI